MTSKFGDTFEITFAYLWCQNRPQYIWTLQVELAEFILSPEQIRILLAWQPAVSRVRYEPGVEDHFSSARPRVTLTPGPGAASASSAAASSSAAAAPSEGPAPPATEAGGSQWTEAPRVKLVARRALQQGAEPRSLADYAVDKDGKCTYYRQFAGWLWSQGQKEKAEKFLNEYETIDWNDKEWVDANNIWKNAGPAMFGRERITKVDLTKMHQISLYTLTGAGQRKSAPAGLIEEAEPVDETIMETRGFRMLMKGIQEPQVEVSRLKPAA